jgi:electron transfer flavoprotein alpha subunit
MAILVIAEHDNATLKGSTLNTVTAASRCGGDIDILIAGYQCGAAAQAAAEIAGVSRVLVADASHFADSLAENVAEQAISIAGNYSHILAPANAFGKNILPRVAARLDVAQISEIIHVCSPDTFERPIYAGNAIATVQSSDPVKVITVRTTGFAPAAAGAAATAIENVAVVADAGTSHFVARDLAKSGRPELSGAKVIVAGGRGVGSAENFKIVEQLADKLGAAIGASRAAVDAGFVPNDWQIGQTGKIVAPQLYIALGISGAIQHVAGIKDSKTIVAINNDPDAPIFLVADYGVIGDVHELVPQLIAELG